MRFKIDENLPDALVAVLEEKGHDACTARDQRLNGRPDLDLAAACKGERRAIVTLDLDFSDITAFPPEEYAGIIVLRVRSQSKAHVLSVFTALLPLLETEPLDRNLWIVEENRVRVWYRWGADEP
jgi:predicted nuclease of predicted toxin-antitoxin system